MPSLNVDVYFSPTLYGMASPLVVFVPVNVNVLLTNIASLGCISFDTNKSLFPSADQLDFPRTSCLLLLLTSALSQSSQVL